MNKLAPLSQTLHCSNLCGGEWKTRGDLPRREVRSPYTGEVIGTVPLSDSHAIDEVVLAAKNAFESWRETPIKERSQYLYKFRDLILADVEHLAQVAAYESGKTVGEAKAGILKGVEVIEFALSLQNMAHGSALEVSRGVWCEARREPLGVVAGIAPFNFPAMVPLWMYPIAITLGNCFVLKPSEKVPLTSYLMGELIRKAGFPAGVFSIANGSEGAVHALAVHPDVKAVAFVGSTKVAKLVYETVTGKGKRALCLGGAKNCIIIVPDADKALTSKGVLDSFTGCAGQRCMAGSLLLAVGDVGATIDSIVAAARGVELGPCMGAIIDRESHARISAAIERAAQEGAKILLDGRKAKIPDMYSGGNWMGPTIIDNAKFEMSCVGTEIFGPVLTIMRVNSLSEALAIEAKLPYGNATSVFTTSGSVARYVSDHASAGMIGVNVGVPVPREPFSFGGTKDSKFGHGDITGISSLEFWTSLKKVTSKWSAQKDETWMS